jgi:hypothetical protein
MSDVFILGAQILYMPRHWFWLADDGRLYSSELNALTTTSDPLYQAFLDIGRTATRWPEDVNGNQTDAEMGSIVAPYGITYP